MPRSAIGRARPSTTTARATTPKSAGVNSRASQTPIANWESALTAEAASRHRAARVVRSVRLSAAGLIGSSTLWMVIACERAYRNFRRNALTACRSDWPETCATSPLAATDSKSLQAFRSRNTTLSFTGRRLPPFGCLASFLGDKPGRLVFTAQLRPLESHGELAVSDSVEEHLNVSRPVDASRLNPRQLVMEDALREGMIVNQA